MMKIIASEDDINGIFGVIEMEATTEFRQQFSTRFAETRLELIGFEKKNGEFVSVVTIKEAQFRMVS